MPPFSLTDYNANRKSAHPNDQMRDRTYAITARDEAFLAVCAYLAVAIFYEMNITSKHHEA
jgi:hypothetical protein